MDMAIMNTISKRNELGLNPLKQVKSFGLIEALKDRAEMLCLNPLKQVKSFGQITVLVLNSAALLKGLNPLKQVKSFGLNAEVLEMTSGDFSLNPLKQVKSFGLSSLGVPVLLYLNWS